MHELRAHQRRHGGHCQVWDERQQTAVLDIETKCKLEIRWKPSHERVVPLHVVQNDFVNSQITQACGDIEVMEQGQTWSM